MDENLSTVLTLNYLPDICPTDSYDEIRLIADTKGGLFPDDSDWIFTSDDFRQWHGADHARLLWVEGDTGTGMLMLASAIVEELESQLLASSTVPSFPFCPDASENLASFYVQSLSFLGPGEVGFISGEKNGRPLKTCADTSASLNIASCDTVEALGFTAKPEVGRHVVTPCGRYISG